MTNEEIEKAIDAIVRDHEIDECREFEIREPLNNAVRALVSQAYEEAARIAEEQGACTFHSNPQYRHLGVSSQSVAFDAGIVGTAAAISKRIRALKDSLVKESAPSS